MTNEEFIEFLQFHVPNMPAIEHARKLVAVAEAAKLDRKKFHTIPLNVSIHEGLSCVSKKWMADYLFNEATNLDTALAQLEGTSSETSDEGGEE